METFHNAIEDFKLPCPYQKCLKTINRVIVRELGPWKNKDISDASQNFLHVSIRRQEYYLFKG